MRKKSALVLTAIMLFGSIVSNVIYKNYEGTYKSINKNVKSINLATVDPDTVTCD